MTIDLDRPLARPRWPEGISVRTFDPRSPVGDARRVHALLELAFEGSADKQDPFADWLPAMTGDASFDPSAWFLAEEAGDLVGVALCWPEGYVKDLAVRPRLRGRGLGEALLRHALGELSRRGAASVDLKVDAANPTGAVRLYERVGMRVRERYVVYDRAP